MATKMSARALLVVAIAWSLAAHAPYNATVIGTTLTQFGIALQFSPETVMFDLSSQPTIVCPSGSHFVLSPTTVADAQTRKNMLAMLLHAKATGNQLAIAYDNTGSNCD